VGAVDDPAVTLVDVDELTLDRLVNAAITDAAADEVTPPATTGDEWSPARIAWLKDFHRTRRNGLSGPLGETTWAILAGDQVVGSVRLKRTAVPEILETGIWLTRRTRGQGVGRLAMAGVLQTAATLGAQGVRAETTTGNRAALRVLRSLGFDLVASKDGAGVAALLMILDVSPPDEVRPPGARQILMPVAGSSTGDVARRVKRTRVMSRKRRRYQDKGVRRLSAFLSDTRLDSRSALFDLSRGNVDDLESVVSVDRLVHSLESERVAIADPAGRCRHDESERPDEEDGAFEYLLSRHPRYLLCQGGRDRVPQVSHQRESAQR
jgi:RimJ/RimL family protein N-acetyltransferase